MAEYKDDLIELLYKTIEEKDAQIQELQKTIQELNITVANLNETLEEFRRKFLVLPENGPLAGSRMRKQGRKTRRRNPLSAAIPAVNRKPNGKNSTKTCRSGKYAARCRRIRGFARIVIL